MHQDAVQPCARIDIGHRTFLTGSEFDRVDFGKVSGRPFSRTIYSILDGKNMKKNPPMIDVSIKQ